MEPSSLAVPRHVHWASELHSEYRSTYRWHEYKTEPAAQGSVVRHAPAPQPPSALPIARGPMEPAMPRRKKYPGVAYKANEFFEPGPTEELRPQPSAFNRARSAERNDPTRAGRRSKSEGPRQTRWTDTVEPKATTAMGEVLAAKDKESASTEYRNQFAWPKDTTDSAPRKSISMGALKKAAVLEGTTAEAEPLMNHSDNQHNEEHPKRFIEDYMKPAVQRKSTFRSALSAFISNGEDRSKDNRKRYKSEYKKKFRPFSQYVYEASKGTFTKCRGSKGKTGVNDEGASERMLPETKDVVDAGGDETRVSTGEGGGKTRQRDTWYREVLDLRKRAGEYKYRGWGTELAPDHITQLYDKQIELWYQVSRRSSLSALSLASTNHKVLPRDEKDIKDAKDGKDSKNESPKKFRSFRSAPHQSIHAKIQETKSQERSPHKTSPLKQRKKIQGHSFDEAATHDGSKPGDIKAEFKSPRRRPRSADPAPVTKHLPNGTCGEPHPRPHKPTGLPLGCRGKLKGSIKSSTTSALSPVAAQRRSRSVSKVGIKLEDEMSNHRSASVAKDHFFDDSPVVKSPPEPTRVKSPEQMNMRSPDPVNWTVPLDTGKTFTVTQNVKSDDTVKRPSSDFKGGSVMEDALLKGAEEIAPVHHQMSPNRTLKTSESPTSSKRTDKTPTTSSKRTDQTPTTSSKRTDQTPTTPASSTISLTPIDETKALDLNQIVNGVKSNQITPENPLPQSAINGDSKPEVIKKSIEATQVAPGVVDTTVVDETGNPGGLTASEVLDRARTRFDKFWGKKEENV